jgi:hypothetical protein
MNEIDDGVFDWMLILDFKRRQREMLREDRAARESQLPIQKDVTPTNVTIPQTHDLLSPSLPQPHQGPLSPVSTNGVFNTPARATMEPNNETENTNNTQSVPVEPKSTQEPVRPQQPAPAKKKRKWWQKLFAICRKGDE